MIAGVDLIKTFTILFILFVIFTVFIVILPEHGFHREGNSKPLRKYRGRVAIALPFLFSLKIHLLQTVSSGLIFLLLPRVCLPRQEAVAPGVAPLNGYNDLRAAPSSAR